MAILFMGGEMGAWYPSDGNSYEETTTLYDSYNTSFARCSMHVGGSSSYAWSAEWTASDITWVHLELDFNRPGGGEPIVSGFNGATECFRLSQNGSTNLYSLSVHDGVSLTSVGTSFIASTTRQDFDILIDKTNGQASVYLAGTRRLHATGITVGTTANFLQLHDFGNNRSEVSQIVVADEPTIGWRLLTRYANGVGSDSDWTGTYTDIDEARYDDADFNNSSTNGHEQMYTQTGPAIDGYVVRAVAVTARAKKGASGPSNIQLGLRSSGTNYYSSSKALDVGYGAFIEIWEQNPATAADWVNTAIDSLQFGYKAVT